MNMIFNEFQFSFYGGEGKNEHFRLCFWELDPSPSSKKNGKMFNQKLIMYNKHFL